MVVVNFFVNNCCKQLQARPGFIPNNVVIKIQGFHKVITQFQIYIKLLCNEVKKAGWYHCIQLPNGSDYVDLQTAVLIANPVS